MTGPTPAVAQVRTAVRRALADLSPHSIVLVACSGGADSLALAAATGHVAPREGLRAGAVVVDHELQAGSRAVADAAARQAATLGLDPVDVVTATVGTGGGPEAAARDARYRELTAAAEAHGAAAVLLGHTMDDQAETVLLGLARGSGARSLAGMGAVNGLWRRPLLDVPRAVTRQACEDLGLAPWDDPHNDDQAYARVRVRQQALPALEAALGPGVAASLARTAKLLREDADALDSWSAAVTAALGAPDEEGLDISHLRDLPPAVRARVLKRAAESVGSLPLTAVHVRALDALVSDWRGQGPVALPGGGLATRSCGRLLVSPGSAQPRQEIVRGC
jgi:tRNA(Ile)-lysidine synthase